MRKCLLMSRFGPAAAWVTDSWTVGNMRFSDDLLDEMRAAGDPPADKVVARLFDEQAIDGVNRLMKLLVNNDDVPPAELPPYVRRFLKTTARPPAWADEDRIAEGEEFFGVHGPLIVMAFACASLPACYASRKGVQVLHLTARLQKGAQRRIAETAQLILNVMAPGGLGPDGRGIRDAQKVRLMHAAVRHLCAASGDWDPAWDTPVCQEDLAGTLMTFSIVALDALRTLGVSVSGAEADAYHHSWNVVGHVLGIDERLIVDDVGDAQRLWEEIKRRQWAPSPEGVAMTHALIEAMEHNTPGSVFDGLPSYLVRFLGGDDLGDMLAVRRRDWTSLIGGPLRLFAAAEDMLTDDSALAGGISARFSRQLLEGFSWIARGGERAPFAIPQELASRWGMSRGAARTG